MCYKIHFKIHFNITLLSTLRSFKWSLSFRISHQNPAYISLPSHDYHMDHLTIITNDTLGDMVMATFMLEYILHDDMGSEDTYTKQRQKSREITYTIVLL